METETAANTREDVPTRNGAEAARTRKEDDGVEEARDDKISKDATRATGATRANDDDVSREAYARFVAASAPRYPGPLGPPPGPGMGMHATMSDRMWPADPPGPPPAFAGAASSGRGGSLASNLSELTNDPARVAGAPLSAPLSASAIMNPAYGAYVVYGYVGPYVKNFSRNNETDERESKHEKRMRERRERRQQKSARRR